MLVLTRKLNQDIQIGENVRITVLKIKGNTVRLGIEAPRNIRVVRGELPPDQPAETETEPMANVTIVFDGSADQPETVREPSADSQLPRVREVVPFPESSDPQTVRFRTRMPESLEHGRLKQIVAELRRKNQTV